jgi:hypothetical protein
MGRTPIAFICLSVTARVEERKEVLSETEVINKLAVYRQLNA